MSPARNDPDITEKGPTPADSHVNLPDILGTLLPNAPIQNASEWPGGVWFDLNGNLTWAYGELDGTVPRARGLAWDEYTRNTLANHATLWPDHWDGTISVDDACYAYYSNHPDNCGIGLGTTYQGQITEQPTWMVMNAIRLAGLTPTAAGYRIAPHFPFSRFSLKLPQVGIAADSASKLRGYIRPQRSGPIELQVKLPPGAGSVTTFANGRAVPHHIENGLAAFRLDGRANAPADWAVVG